MTSAVKRSYPFGSRPTSLVDETHQFKVPQAPLHKKMSMTPTSINSPAETSWRMNKSSMNVPGNSIVVPDNKTVTTVNGEKSPLPSPPSAKGRRNMKNLQLVVPPVRSSISAPSSPQLPSSHTHSRRPSTPLCVYQNKGQDNSNTAADPMELMSKTENAIGEELPYKDEPILILPNLYLGSELNAANRTMLNRINIEFILNVAKEVENPYLEEIVNHGTSYNDEYQDSPMSESVCSDDSFRTAIQSPMGASNNIDSPMVPPTSFGEFFTTPINKRSSSTPRPTFTSAQNSMQSGIPLIVPATSDFNSLKYKKFFWTHNQENLNSDFSSAFAFIDEARSAGRNILVHCQCGVSRSASLIIGYVMKANRMTLNQAYEYVKNKSPCISPNMSLVYQLVDFEKTLKLGSNNGTNCSSPGTPTRCRAESKTHSRSSSIESDLLLKTHRRSTSIPRSNPVLSIAPAYVAPEPSPKTPPVVTEGLLTTHLPHQSTVKGGSGRFHVITASISPTSPSAPSPSSPASSVSPTSSESPTTPSSGSSSPSKNSSKSLPPSKNGHLTVSNRSRSPHSSDRTPLTPREIINTPMSPTFATSKSMSTATLHNSSIAPIPFDNLSYARTSRIVGRNHSMIGHEVLSGSASGIFSKSTLESIFSPTRTSPPVTPVTIPNIHDIFLDDE
ncbi:12708_t:CDS:1 [Acaulospora morrowiae]|uniref:protein-tyrosine-phosphatase n=1 Tax=Acaulospora morrowiae TaxID=94023 RepID=A0A9N8WHW3_9GLOM|nr:12708_t:CDS:1 [Acaulospora morrowiae]